jgi:spore maturation protein CgeB
MANKLNRAIFAGSINKYGFQYQHWYLTLQKIFDRVVVFDYHWIDICYGQKIMNQKFLEVIKRDKPEYVFLPSVNDFYFDTLLSIKKISPSTKVIMSFGDDDVQFDNFSRYIMLFVDYGLLYQQRYIKKYVKEGFENIFYINGLNTDFFRPLNLKKIYDVTFIGGPSSTKSLRYNYIKFLKDRGVKIRLFGSGWDKYSEFKDIYGGPLESGEMVRVLNQSKINLCFSLNANGIPHIKGKFYEGSSCKTFVLTEFCKDYLDKFRDGKDIVTFKNKEDLLKKIDYYLKNSGEREKITNNSYKKIIRYFNFERQLKNIFKKTSKQRGSQKKLPKINKKSILLSREDLNKDIVSLKTILEPYDYIYFRRGNCKNSEYRVYLQSYALEKTRKPISCCNYTVNKKYLGDYLYFFTEMAIKNLPKKGFSSFLNINQLMVTKDFFLKNLEKFKRAYQGDIKFITEKNTAFMFFPLIKIDDFNSTNYEKMKNAFIFKFPYQLYSLKYRRKIFSSPYLPALLLEILKGNLFILKTLLEILKDKSRLKQLKIYESIDKK